jgi:nucleotide-binding universal stress UspA family protein
MTTRPVIVGLKEKQPTALRFAVDMALERNVGLRVIHCLEIRSAGDFVSMPHDSWRAAGEAVLEDARHFIDGIDPRPSTEYKLDAELPYFALQEASKHAAMLVVGVDSRHESNLGLFGGTVAGRVAAYSVAPVAIVPEWSWPTDRSDTVVIAVDARGPAAGSMRFAFAEASRRHAELCAIHVVPPEDMVGDTLPHRVGLSEALAGWSEEFPDVKVTRRFVFDDADEGCVQATEEADLLILGRRGNTGSVLDHPVIAEIARRAQCPCIVVPDTWEGR